MGTLLIRKLAICKALVYNISILSVSTRPKLLFLFLENMLFLIADYFKVKNRYLSKTYHQISIYIQSNQREPNVFVMDRTNFFFSEK